MHGLKVKYGNKEDCILFKKELFNNASHHAVNVDAALEYFPLHPSFQQQKT